MKILDLFSGTQSVRKALYLMNIDYEYYGLDIYSPEEDNIILDLSQDDIVNKVIAALPIDWQPDFIWASPVCNKFSLATAVKGGNLYFEKIKDGLKVRENFEVLKSTTFKDIDHKEIIKAAKHHLKIVDNMIKIINYYNVNYVIENPFNSYIIYFLDTMVIKNRVDYCMYGYDYKKPTAIFSNVILKFKTCNHEMHNRKIGSRTTKKEWGAAQQNARNYKERASVPPQLIIDILNIFKKEAQNEPL